MVNQLLVTLVNSLLGFGKPKSRGNYAYVCPFHTSNPPGKMKLEINFIENKEGENKWHCWGCDARGKNLFQLFKKLKATDSKISELKSYVKIVDSNFQYVSNEEKQIELPKEFKSLINPNLDNLVVKHALVYLKKRGIFEEDIIKYDLGYCEKGEYSNRVIIPSYDENGKLNYFMSRSFEPTVQSHKNPPLSRDIIPFEFFINWNSPIILCEGPFDAMTIKRNVIPLLGKNIQNNLMKKLITSKVKKIYIVLDKDAMKNSIEYCENLMNEGKKIYLVELDKKDPNKMGFLEFTKTIQKTKQLTFSKLLEKKLELI
jgi:DNA primase